VKKNCNVPVSKALFQLLLIICLTGAAVFSAGFVFSHLEHDCTGVYCPVCIQYVRAGELIKQAAGIALSMAGIGLCGIRSPLKLNRFFFHPLRTKVTLKVQLNN
jgi:hypothetical protein